jgi:hypothetical protein
MFDQDSIHLLLEEISRLIVEGACERTMKREREQSYLAGA